MTAKLIFWIIALTILFVAMAFTARKNSWGIWAPQSKPDALSESDSFGVNEAFLALEQARDWEEALNVDVQTWLKANEPKIPPAKDPLADLSDHDRWRLGVITKFDQWRLEISQKALPQGEREKRLAAVDRLEGAQLHAGPQRPVQSWEEFRGEMAEHDAKYQAWLRYQEQRWPRQPPSRRR